MELSPQSVRTTGFKTVKKGYDPDEVDAFKDRVAGAIESAQNQATAMEARARAAVAKLQEFTQAGSGGAVTQSGETSTASPATTPDSAVNQADADTISRTLLLAQRTADSTVAQAKAEADSLTTAARSEASVVLDAARANAARLVDDGHTEGRRACEEERMRAENEVQALMARRDFLVSDVDHLEQHIGVQRERLRDAAVAIHDIVDRVPGGLGEIRRPLLSASADKPATSEAQSESPSGVQPQSESPRQSTTSTDHDRVAEPARDPVREVLDSEPTPIHNELPLESVDPPAVGQRPQGGFTVHGDELH